VGESPWGFESLRPHVPKRLTLRPDERVEDQDRLSLRDGYVIPRPAAPLDPQPVAGVGEQSANVVRPIRELVPRIGVVLALHMDAIQTSPTVSVDEAAQERTWCGVDNGVLPIYEFDPPEMLPAGTMLGQEADPRPPGCVHAYAALSAVIEPGDGTLPALHGLDRVATLRNDSGISLVKCNPKRPGASVSRQASVTEVDTQKVRVRIERQSREVMRIAVAGRTGCPHPSRRPSTLRQAATSPFPDRVDRNAGNGADLTVRPTQRF
jgi:hypothetical protein